MLDLAAFVECPHCLKLSRRNVDIWGDRSREWVVQGNKIAESGFEFHAVCCLAVVFCSGFFNRACSRSRDVFKTAKEFESAAFLFCHRYGVKQVVEQPCGSLLFNFPPLRAPRRQPLSFPVLSTSVFLVWLCFAAPRTRWQTCR